MIESVIVDFNESDKECCATCKWLDSESYKPVCLKHEDEEGHTEYIFCPEEEVCTGYESK